MFPFIRKSLNSLSIVPPFTRLRSCRGDFAQSTADYNRHVLGEVLTAVVTPFRADGAVDIPAFRSLCAFLLDHGSDGVVVTGTTGEAPTLSDEERMALYGAALEEIGDRGTVVAGTGTYDTAHTVHLTEQAHALGVRRLPRRHAVLQPAAAAWDRRARRGRRGCH